MAQPRQNQNLNYDHHNYNDHHNDNDHYHPDLNLTVSYNVDHQFPDNYHPPFPDSLASHHTNNSTHQAGHLTTQALTNLATIWSLAHQRYTRLHPVAPTSKEYSSTTHVNPPASCLADDTPNPLPATRHLARNGSCLR